MGDGFEAFEINDFDLEHAFNPLKRKRFSKHQQTYGVWADEEDESGSDQEADDGFGGGRKKGKKGSSKSKDFTAPINFISGGVKKGDKISKEETKNEEDEDEPIQIKSFSTAQKYPSKMKQSGNKKSSTTMKNEIMAGFRGPGSSNTQNYADWEKYTKGIGSKLLSKMGHKYGAGLGREGQGIAEPIKAAVRPGRGAVGMYGPEVKGPKFRKDKNDEKNEGVEENEVDEEQPSSSGYQKGQWRKDGGRQQRPKYHYKTWDEVVNENATFKKNWTENRQGGTMKIIDMTGKEQKVYSDFESFRHRTKAPPVETVEEAKAEKRRYFDVPELRYNLDLLVDMTEESIITNDRQLRFQKDQNVTLKRDLDELSTKIVEQEKEGEHLNQLLNVIDEFNEKCETKTATLDDCKTLIKQLQNHFYTEYKMFGLSDIALTNVLPLIKKYFLNWRPLESPEFGLDLMREWKDILEETGYYASRSSSVESMDVFHRLLWDGWIPQVRRAALQWDPRNCDEMINFIEIWIPILPNWILENILEQIILPLLQNEVEKWDPTTDTLPIHSWLHPWLPLMGDRLQPVYGPIRHKLSRALSQWHPRDPSAKMVLKPWKDVFAAGTMDSFLAQNILPKLEHCLATQFVVDPSNQQLDVWHWLTNWLDMISPIHVANLLIKHFFPKWHEALYKWLGCVRPNYNEISQWYTGWKSLFPEDLLAFQTVKDQFNHSLEMMNRALAGVPPVMPGAQPATSSVPDHVHQKNLDFLASRIPGPSAPANFKDLIDMKSAENNILFMPIPNKFREGKPVYKFGPCQMYIDRNVVFVLQNNQWLPVSVEQLVSMAKSFS